MQTMCERLKLLREEIGLTKKDTAKVFDLPYTTYVNYEAGTREPSFAFMIEGARFYGVTVDFLVGASDIRNPLSELLVSDNISSIGENGVRKHISEDNKMINQRQLLSELGITVKNTNYIMRSDGTKTLISDQEYDFVMGCLDLFKKCK